MKIEQLQYLVEIADSGSFTTAAEKLHVGQPSISQSISSLEAELGVVLLNRTRAGTSPTQIGWLVIEQARKIMSTVNGIELLARNELAESQLVSVVAGTTPLATFIPEAIEAAKVIYPHGTVHLREGATQLAEAIIAKGEADFAITAYIEFLNKPHLAFHPLLSSHLVALVNSTSPLASKKALSLKDLQPYSISLGPEGYPSADILIDKISAYGKVHVILRTQNTSLVRRLVVRNGIVGLVYDISLWEDYLTCADSEQNGICIIPVADFSPVTLGILHRQKQLLSPFAKELMHQLKDAACRYQNMYDGLLAQRFN